MADIALLEKVLKHIEADPEHWNQRRWCTPTMNQRRGVHGLTRRRPCRSELPIDANTSFCFAGWAVQLGAEPAVWADAQELYMNTRDDQAAVSWTPQGPVVSVSERARRLLGLTYGQASYLFDSGRDLAGIQRFIHLLRIENRMWKPRATVSRPSVQPRATVSGHGAQQAARGEAAHALVGERPRELVDA